MDVILSRFIYFIFLMRWIKEFSFTVFALVEGSKMIGGWNLFGLYRYSDKLELLLT